MVAWLERLVGRRRTSVELAPEPAVEEMGEPEPMVVGFALAELPELPADRQFTVWDRLADDPQAQEIRAYWESKWATFCEPVATGGPPARGDRYPFWQPTPELAPAERARWQMPAYRLAIGVEVVAHLEPIVDEERLHVGFCVRSAELAELMRDSIERENVGAISAKAHPGQEQAEACDVLIACAPDASDDDVKCAVVATTKTAHVFFCATPPPNA